MRRIISSLSLLAVCAANLPAMSVRAEDGLKGIETLHGACKKLTVAAKDRTSECKGVLLNTRYDDGRTGYYFVTLDGAIITFSSPGEADPRTAATARAYPVDMIIFKAEGDIRKLAAKGACRATLPSGALSGLSCRADSEVGRFEGEFTAGTKAPGL
ncbi:hypothetical protein [Bradyrhizobium sp. ORS 285]|uniref:hypothetical protein n=1 Tax=Bradyrhizobium sp. ORS 285 TaxID=115808 RepID=UPI001111F5CE|nr:hypothetical protein [Bradyrhizobium sp. ORS 285]